MRDLLLALGAAAAVLALLLSGLSIAGFQPALVVGTAFSAAFGSPARLAITIQEAVPLLFCGLGCAIAFRTGVLNIGLEGQCLIGGAAAVAVLTAGPEGLALQALALAAGALAGAAWMGVAWLLERSRGVPLVLSTILLNTVAVLLLGMLVQGPLHDPTTTAPQSALVPDGNRLPALFAGTPIHLGAALALLMAVCSWLVQVRTPLGFELTVTGRNPLAARMAGIPVEAHQRLAAFGSGALAGLAGAVQVAAVTFFLSLDTRAFGYAGIAVALLGRLHPLGVVAAALFFAGLDVGARGLERKMGIPHDLGDLAKGLTVAIVLLAGARAQARGRR